MNNTQGFGGGFSKNFGGDGFNSGFFKPVTEAVQESNSDILYSNYDSYIINGTRQLHGTSDATGFALTNVVTRSNITRVHVIKATSTVTVQGFKFVRVPCTLGNWGFLTDDMDLVLTIKSGGTINGSGSKTFATMSKFRTNLTGRTSGVSENTLRDQYDLLTIYDATPVTLTAGTYTMTFKAINTQIGIAHAFKTKIPIVTTGSIFPDPDDSTNATIYPVLQIMSKAP